MKDFRNDGGNRFGGGQGGGFRGGNGGGRPSFPRKNWGGGDRPPVTMHQAICDECKKSCEVPFRPSGDKPVYCSDCFGSKREGRDNRGGERAPQRNFNDYKTPSRNDFGGSSNKGGNDEVKKQLEMLNSKMDRLIKTLEGVNSGKIVPVTAVEKVKEVPKVASTVKVKKSAKKVSKKSK